MLHATAAWHALRHLCLPIMLYACWLATAYYTGMPACCNRLYHRHSCARAGLIKVCLSYENGLLPGNLHYKEPNPNNESLKAGILKVRWTPASLPLNPPFSACCLPCKRAVSKHSIGYFRNSKGQIFRIYNLDASSAFGFLDLFYGNRLSASGITASLTAFVSCLQSGLHDFSSQAALPSSYASSDML